MTDLYNQSAQIRFIRDARIIVQDTQDTMPYIDMYVEEDHEHVDILIENENTVHVQFGDGSVAWIEKRFIKIIPFVDD
jgi:hypothetical protein